MTRAPYRLVLLRHGESEWNARNLFTGWVDVALSDRGRAEAARGAALLVERDIRPDVVHTSVLRRAISTADICLDGIDRHWVPVRRSWRLNERHYGALQGKDTDSEFSQSGDERYADLPPELRPSTECLADVLARVLPYWYDEIVPDLRRGVTVLVAAHGNSLRALVKHLDDMSEQAVVSLNIPTGIPLLYELGEDMRPLRCGGEYLDPEAAAVAIQAVANQGR
jgi:2,3-bisphosphoglycerate-dependent phosphoglycerate mutase